jgi:hypothetical protein
MHLGGGPVAGGSRLTRDPLTVALVLVRPRRPGIAFGGIDLASLGLALSAEVLADRLT